MKLQDKIRIGKLLDKHRIIQIRYNSNKDFYIVDCLDKKDKEKRTIITGDLLD